MIFWARRRRERERGGYNYVPATFQIIYGIGWKNHESQQQPDERGSAQGKIGFVEVEKS